MLYQSTATYAPFHADNLQQAISIAVEALERESEGVCKLVSAERDGGNEGQQAACLVSITKNPTDAEKERTERTELPAGEKAELQELKRLRTTERRFVVKPHQY